MFTPPAELLVAQPVSTTTSRLLGSFSQAVAGLKAEHVDGNKYSAETAEATIQAFYATGGACHGHKSTFSKRAYQPHTKSGLASFMSETDWY